MTRRNTMLLVAVAAIAAVGAYWMLVLSPKREEAVALDTQISTKQAALAQAEAEVASYEQARGSYKANYSLVARLGKAVPADDDMRSLMVQLNAVADKTKVDFRTINISAQGAPAAGPGAVPATGPAPPPGASITELSLTDDSFLHANPYPNTAAPGQDRECEAGNERYRENSLRNRQAIGNLPGSQDTSNAPTRRSLP